MVVVMEVFDRDFNEFIAYARDNPYAPAPRRYLRDVDNPIEFYTDDEFFRRFCFSKETVIDIIVPLLTQDNGDKRGLPVPTIVKVTTALRFYGSNSFQIVCGDLNHLNQSTVSIIVKVVSQDLAKRLQQYVHFPGVQKLRENTLSFFEVGGFPGVSGCIDCTHLGISSPGGQFAELYRNRKQYMSLNVQVVSGPNLETLDIVTRWPGSTHDSRIFNNSRVMVRFETKRLPGHLLGDNGYPQFEFLYTPVLAPVTPAEIRYNIAHKRTRNLVERLFGVWKRRFACLGHRLRIKLQTSSTVLFSRVLCCIMWQFDVENLCRHQAMRTICQQCHVAPRNNRGAAIRRRFIE